MRALRRRFVAVAALALAAVAACPQSTPAAGQLSAPALKAAFLFNFARFTEWPSDSPPGPITLCVLGDATLADALDRLAGDRQIGGREVSVARLATNRAVKTCHLLYLAGTDAAIHARALDEVAHAPVLTVGDGEQFVRIGGLVGLFFDRGRMRFAVNTDAVQRAGLKLSSQLLGLARLYRDEHVES